MHGRVPNKRKPTVDAVTERVTDADETTTPDRLRKRKASLSGHSLTVTVHCWWLGRSPPEKQSGVSPVHVLSPFGGVNLQLE